MLPPVRRQWLFVVLVGAALSCRPGAASSAAAPSLAPASALPLDRELFAVGQAEVPAALRDLEELVNIDSGTGDADGLAKVSALLVARLNELGARVDTTSAAPSVGTTITGTLRGSDTRDLLLRIHCDMVFA